MQISFWTNHQQPWSDLLDAATHADRTGWHAVFVADHFMGDAGGFGPVETPTLEGTAMIAALAGVTQQVRIGSLVFGTTYRHPAVLANWAATVDHISRGRLTLGIGTGWQVNEHDQYGIALPPVRQLVDRFAEVCEVTLSLLREPTTSFTGEWFTLTGAVCEPKPVQSPLPLLIGGKGDRMLGLVARFADRWNMWSTPAQLAERRTVLDQRCETIGRDPATIATSTQALVLLTDDAQQARRAVASAAPRAMVAGPVSALVDVVGQWQDVGVDEVIVPDFLLGSGTRRRDAMDEILDALGAAFS
jgi:alkanesulfonate monooxygenase SsuD/methylene tetrahydromethanopterin reductase-like flavin-dependent oxidoreductase (luciferase family)